MLLREFCQKRIGELSDLIKAHERVGAGHEIFRCKGQIESFREISAFSRDLVKSSSSQSPTINELNLKSSKTTPEKEQL